MLYTIGAFLFRFIFFNFFKLKIWGRENIPKKGACIVAANHISYLDPPLVGSVLFPHRKIWYMAKKELFAIPIFGTILKLVRAFPVRRGKPDREALWRALRLLRKGEVVCVFPEGTRSRDGRLKPPELGISLLSLYSSAPILPVAIVGTNKALPPDRILPRPARIEVYIGKPFHPLIQGERKAQRQEIARQVMKEIEGLLLQSGKYPPSN